MATLPTPQRKSTFRSRVGGAIRRSSTAFSIPGLPNRGNSVTPPPPDSDTASITGSVSGKLDREGSTTSLNRIDTTSPPPPVSVSSAPSPIPESPAREAAALAAEPQPAAAKATGPSPLANEVLRADTASKQGSTPPRSISGTPPPPEIAAVLTAEPEEMPAQRVEAPSALSSRPASKSGTPPPPASLPPTPAALATTGSDYFGDIPRSTTPVGLDSDPDTTNVWADQRGGTTGSDSGSEAPRGRVLTSNPSKSSLRPRDSSVASSQVAPPLNQSRTTSRKASGVIQSRQTELADVTKTWSSSSEMGFASKTSLA
ncbi:hypothetical protein OG21DRAFT_856466 [Imleria badia]|nr:hypothetical protein OG21DRAFT_856466 [Imleria badia]